MGETTEIAWTDATFNAWWGCQRVSPGCEHCYAEAQAKRYGHDVWGRLGPRREMSDAYWKQPAKWNARAERDGVRVRVFCGSMCDWAEDHPIAEKIRPRLFELIEATPWLDWLMLTKRPQNVRGMVPRSWRAEGRRNVWLGTTTEDQKRLDERLPHLQGEFWPAVRFISAEPLLGPLKFPASAMTRADAKRRQDTAYWNFSRQARSKPPSVADPDAYAAPLDWVIVGGESGPGAREFDLDWARDIVDQCRIYDVAPFVKQLGANPNGLHVIRLRDRKGGDVAEWPHDLRVREFPRAAA